MYVLPIVFVSSLWYFYESLFLFAYVFNWICFETHLFHFNSPFHELETLPRLLKELLKIGVHTFNFYSKKKKKIKGNKLTWIWIVEVRSFFFMKLSYRHLGGIVSCELQLVTQNRRKKDFFSSVTKRFPTFWLILQSWQSFGIRKDYFMKPSFFACNSAIHTLTNTS